ARLCRGDGSIRSAGRRIPRSLCRILRSRFRLCGVRRPRFAGGAGSAFARSAVHSRTRSDRRPARLRANVGTARSALRQRDWLELSGAGIEIIEALSLAGKLLGVLQLRRGGCPPSPRAEIFFICPKGGRARGGE